MGKQEIVGASGPRERASRSSAADPAADRLRIFLNYRRDDAGGRAYRLWDALTHPRGGQEGFAEEQIFMDIDTLEPGVDFVEAIHDAVASCDVFLAVIGRRWVGAADAEGNRRLDNPEDFVRLEIEAALERGVRVIPIRVDGAEMPRSNELPPSLANLTRRHAVPITDESWLHEAGKLFNVLKKLERDKARSAATAPEATAAPEPALEEEKAEPRPVEPAPPPAPKPAPTPRAARYDVVLVSAGTNKARAKALVRDLAALSAKRSGELVASLPATVMQGVPRGEADFIAAVFAQTGGETELEPTDRPARTWRPSLFRLGSQLLREDGDYPSTLASLGPQVAVGADVPEPEQRLKRHLLVLGAQLEEGEKLVNLALGSLDWTTGVLGVTDRRLLFVSYVTAGVTAEVTSFRYENVSSVTEAFTVTSGKLNIVDTHAGGARLKAVSHLAPALKSGEIMRYARSMISTDA